MDPLEAEASAGRAPVREIVHDLRSALAAATAYLDLAREQLERGETVKDEDLAPVTRNLDRLNAAVEKLDDLTRGGKAR